MELDRLWTWVFPNTAVCSTAQFWGVHSCLVPTGSADPYPTLPPRGSFIPASLAFTASHGRASARSQHGSR